jgi:transglutaminase-like putative cysteine protease
MPSERSADLLRSLRRLDGWFTIGLVALICMSLAWSLDDALLVLGRDEYTDFLVWAAIGGAAAGWVGPLVGWGRWTTHAIGAVVAALVTTLLVGGVLMPEGGPLGVLFKATADQAVEAWADLIVAGRLSTLAYGHHLLLLGLITWGTAQFASYAAFGHRRPINGIVVIGLLLLANMSLTSRDQLVFLVIFSVASLFVLVRFHILEEQTDWLRRRIGDPSAISAMYLRGGTVFIVAAITGSLLLTNAASSAPLGGAWTDVGARVIEWSQFLTRYLPQSRDGRPIGPTFSDTAVIGSKWNTGDDVQLRLTYAEPEVDPPFIAAHYYDQFALSGWQSSPAGGIERQPGDDLLGGTGDAVPDSTRRLLTATIGPAFARGDIFLPGLPDVIDQPVTVELIGAGGGYLSKVAREPSSGDYTVTTTVPADEKDGGPTEALLRVAGTAYPDEIRRLYGKASLPPGSLGPKSTALLQDIVASAASDDPYDLAKRIRDVLRDPGQFHYDTDLTNVRCTDPSNVECFVVNRRGFCQWYATAMAVFLRELDIPARFVQGFLPGQPDNASRSYTIRAHDSHAWVQVYFPSYGWIDFDPTGNPNPDVPTLAPIPSGRPVASASAKPSGNGGAGGSALPTRIERDPGAGFTGSGRARDRGINGLVIAVALLLAVIVGAVAVIVWRRGARGPITAEDAYGSVVRLAARLGFARRPTQTVYEYAGALADELPMVRPELETVARAKVEVAYGGRQLEPDRLAGLRDAHRRLRVNLLRLVTHRRKRGGGGRRPRVRRR